MAAQKATGCPGQGHGTCLSSSVARVQPPQLWEQCQGTFSPSALPLVPFLQGLCWTFTPSRISSAFSPYSGCAGYTRYVLFILLVTHDVGPSALRVASFSNQWLYLHAGAWSRHRSPANAAVWLVQKALSGLLQMRPLISECPRDTKNPSAHF